MMRDTRMARLVQTEPITPFLHRVRALYQERGVRTILVAGSCGDFFDVADIVIKMQEYTCIDVTKVAKQICQELPSQNLSALKSFPASMMERRVEVSSLQPRGKVKADRDRGILFGETEIDLTHVEQLVEASQTRFIMDCLVHLGKRRQGSVTMPALLDELEVSLSREQGKMGDLACPLDLVSPWAGPNGAYTRPRKQ